LGEIGLKICVFGTGALGSVFGGRLAAAGEDVTLIARGAQLAAIRKDGLKLIAAGRETAVRPRATDDPAAPGPQDIVLLATKAYSLPQVAGALGPLLGPETGVVMLQNGIHWWHFHGIGGRYDGTRLASVDAEGACERAIGLGRAIGGAVYCPAEVTAPGTVRHAPDPRIVMGEAAGPVSDRLARFAEALGRAGVKGEPVADIRLELWRKLLNLIASAPVAVLTGSNNRALNLDEGTRSVMSRLTAELIAVAGAVGSALPAAALDRFRQPGDAPANKVSTLQDLERGKPLEIDGVIGVVAEIGRLAGVATPAIDMAYALCRRMAEERGLYPANPGFRLGYTFA
jgi:2-dehydropantoate 2-reductase